LRRAGRAVKLRPAPKARNAAHPQERQHSAARRRDAGPSAPGRSSPHAALTPPASGVVTRTVETRVARDDSRGDRLSDSGAKRLEPGLTRRRTAELAVSKASDLYQDVSNCTITGFVLFQQTKLPRIIGAA
jgi:hypothetical protein